MDEEYEVMPTWGLNEDGDYALHADTGFCPFGCPCHEDQELIGEVNEQYQSGLLTPDEATRTVAGGTV
jgi:hypothetical protein